MSKYDPLRDYLANLPASDQEQTLAFNEIDGLLGSKLSPRAYKYSGLPPSVYEHREWWANTSSADDHPHAQSWLSVGWRVDAADLDKKKVRFRRSRL